MIAKNCTLIDLNKALGEVNKLYDGNVRFKDIRTEGRRIRFTLTVYSARGKGGRIGFSGKHVAAACWHVHGHFFDALLSINPKAIVETSKSVIYRDLFYGTDTIYGNWLDTNIGSLAFPLYYSEACECEE